MPALKTQTIHSAARLQSKHRWQKLGHFWSALLLRYQEKPVTHLLKGCKAKLPAVLQFFNLFLGSLLGGSTVSLLRTAIENPREGETRAPALACALASLVVKSKDPYKVGARLMIFDR